MLTPVLTRAFHLFEDILVVSEGHNLGLHGGESQLMALVIDGLIMVEEGLIINSDYHRNYWLKKG